jgi:2-polyprenyl-3-methyl-5-hydroxy-6-metoxy-1,4-benzoquinol methylase
MTTATHTTPRNLSQTERTTEAFGERLVGIMVDSAVAMSLSIGHRTGLFDTMSGRDWSTSAEIADAAGLNERYVREWLGAMVTGLIVDYDPATRTYRLPAEHAALLTRGSREGNFAATMQWVAVLGGVEDRIVDVFRNGGGVGYGCFHRFHEVMATESAQTVVAALLDHILPMEAGLREQLIDGIDVLDVGCGSGLAMIQLAEHFPASNFAGYDLCEEAIERASTEAKKRGLTNVRFEVRDLTEFNETHRYDLITAFDAIHDQKAPAKVLRAIRQALRPGGLFLMQDIRASSHLEKNIGQPLAPFLFTISTMHCMTVSLAQDGAGLGTCWGEELAAQMLTDAGFGPVRIEQLDHDIMNNYYLTRPA